MAQLVVVRYYECDRDNDGENEAPPPENATRKDIAWQLVSAIVPCLRVVECSAVIHTTYCIFYF